MPAGRLLGGLGQFILDCLRILGLKPDLDVLVDELLNLRKYRGGALLRQTVRDVLERELVNHRSEKDAVKEVRRKLHNIAAPYLGDHDYPAAEAALQAAFTSGDPAREQAVCLDLLGAHASTRERIPLLDEFYSRIFALTGVPDVVLDLACGLNPFALPWMGLPAGARYHAYDLHAPRIALINRFLQLRGQPELGELRDILVDPPQIEAPVAFFFKEAHRFEQRQHGCNRAFWQAVRTRWLLVSLPVENLTGQHSLLERQRRLVANTIAGLPWGVSEIQVGSELIFCIDKQTGEAQNG